MHSQITTTIVGHLITDPRQFPARESVGCDLRILITRQFIDNNGIPRTGERRVKVVTYDTVMAERLLRDFKQRDFVEITCTDVRVERAWKNRQDEWVSGSAVFTLAKIRKVGSSARHNEQAETATDPAAEAAELLSGVTKAAGARAAPGNPSAAARGEPLSPPIPRGLPVGPDAWRSGPTSLPTFGLRSRLPSSSPSFGRTHFPWTMTGHRWPSPALRTPSPPSPTCSASTPTTVC
jgi:hypothetical protein